MRRLWMLLLELLQRLRHVFVVSTWSALDSTLGFLSRRSGLFGSAFDLACATFHFLDCPEEANRFIDVQGNHPQLSAAVD